jgi:uncharacterized cofD-like protein
MTTSKMKVVVVGGGTGTYTLLRGLRQYHDDLEIAAIVTMADSGGSTGRLRDEFGQLPVGDVRQALAALSPDVAGTNNLLRDLFLYRFKSGEGLSGHNFGNLFLTALTDMLGSEAEAIEAAGVLLRIEGRVIPVTTDKVHLRATFTSGRTVTGEHEIDEPALEYADDRIATLSLTPAAALSPEAKQALIEADCIIFGPGDFYTSILANTVVHGFADAVKASRATIIFVANLMARPGQTIGMHLADYVAEFERYTTVLPHIVLVPDSPLPESLVRHYAETESVHPVGYDFYHDQILVHKAPIVSAEIILPQTGDTLTRSLIRHQSEILAATIVDLLHR